MKTPTDPLHLNPEVVNQVQFTSVRNIFTGRVGYLEAEVDDFLDLVEARIAQLMRDRDQALSLIEAAEEVGWKLEAVRDLLREIESRNQAPDSPALVNVSAVWAAMGEKKEKAS